MYEEIVVADPEVRERGTSEEIPAAPLLFSRRTSPEIVVASPNLQQPWDRYVNRHPDFTHCHRWFWKNVIEKAFGHPTRYLVALESGRICGVLPLVWQESLLFGSFVTSMPFLNAGGALADSVEIERQLAHRAVSLAQQSDAKYLQLRYRSRYQLSFPAATHKVATVRAVTSDIDAMWRSLDPKNRRKVNKAIKSGLSANPEGVSALDDFYSLYAMNMRNLGTPVYGKEFFSEIVRAFPNDIEIIMVRRGVQPIASAFLFSYRDVMEAAWGCSDWKYLSLQPNMLLYWTMLKIAGERGYNLLDFGRSTKGSGPHKFKQLWDTQDVQLYWARWSPAGTNVLDLNPANSRFRWAERLWSKLPLQLTKIVGPHIVKYLP